MLPRKQEAILVEISQIFVGRGNVMAISVLGGGFRLCCQGNKRIYWS